MAGTEHADQAQGVLALVDGGGDDDPLCPGSHCEGIWGRASSSTNKAPPTTVAGNASSTPARSLYGPAPALQYAEKGEGAHDHEHVK